MDYTGEDVGDYHHAPDPTFNTFNITTPNTQNLNLNQPIDQPVNQQPQFTQQNQQPQHQPQFTQQQLDEYNGMPPPILGEHKDLKDLMNAAQAQAKHYGYAIVTASNNYKRGIAYVRCDRGGDYVNHWNLTDETRVRKKRTRRLVGCKWKARAKKNSTGMWELTMMCDKHNGHDASDDAASHPSQRQLSDEAKEAARQAFDAKQSPKQVLDLLQKNYNPAVTAQDVYNLKAKINRTPAAPAAPAAPVAPTPAVMQRTIEPEDIPTDPALKLPGRVVYLPFLKAYLANLEAELNPVQRPTALQKCQCTCCDH